MVCPKCGAQIGSGDLFCTKCGFSVNAQQNAQMPQGGRKNWKDYLTRENIEYLVAAAGAFPLVLMIAGDILGFFGGIYAIGFIFRAVKAIITFAVIISALGACAGIGLLMTKDRSMMSPSGYLAAGAAGLSLISVIITAASKGSNGFAFVIGLIALIAGLDVISRVFLQNAGLASNIDIGKDFGLIADFIKKAIDQFKQQKAEQERLVAQARAQSASSVSYFDGKGLELLGYMLLTSILSALTFSLATPWTVCMMLKWRKSHTVINGRRLTFTGTGGQMLGLWIKWILLSLITFGIYAFFAYVDYLKWEARHTFFDDEHPANGAENPNSAFDGNTLEFVGYSLLGSLITSVTLGIAFPWVWAMLMDWEMKHYVVSGYRMSFDGNGLQFLGTCIVCILLCAVTFGLYSPWATIRMNNWVYSHTHTAVPMVPAGYVPYGTQASYQ